MGRARRSLPSSMSKQTLVVMRYSQVLNDERPSNRSLALQALIKLSWTASSASNEDPSIR